MTMKKKIVFFLGSMRRGGAERVISILSKEYASKGWQTDIAVLLFYELCYDIDQTTRLLDFTGNTESRKKRVFYWIRSIRQYVKKESPDVIVSFAARINALVQLACVGLDVPIVVSERIDPRYDGRELPVRILNNIFYPKAKKVVFQTKRIQSYFNRRIQENGCIILNPIAVTAYAKRERKKKIVAVGRVTEQKNHRLLIESFSDVVREYPEYELWIYGDGELIPQLKELNRTLKIGDQLHFPGNKPNIHQEIADAEIFVLSSDYEGLSNALMEAMMMGLPCISTDCSGSDEIIEDGVNGLLVPIMDRKRLTMALLKLISEPDLRDRLGEAARKKAREFSAEVVVNKWIEIIE